MTPTKSIKIQIPESLHATLTELKAVTGLSLADHVRVALSRYVTETVRASLAKPGCVPNPQK